MAAPHSNASQPAPTARLKRADAHLRAVAGMLESGRPCLDIAQRLHAVEKAMANAGRALVHGCADHYLGTEGSETDRAEHKAISRYR
jgi:DNA-binding FrmR family transcriptional regulator